MTDEQIKACRELIRVARAVAVTARGLMMYSSKDSTAEATLRDIEQRLEEASEAAHAALNTKVEPIVQVH